MIGFDQTATVYTPDPTTGAYTVVDKTGLSCRLAVVTVTGADPGPGRVELVDERRLLWEPGYAMPAEAQVEITSHGLAGRKWNVQVGSVAAIRGPSGSVAYHRARVVEAV
jgi:hypothetical protein